MLTKRRRKSSAIQMTPRLLTQMIEALQTGENLFSISRDTGVCYTSVCRWLKPVVAILPSYAGTPREMIRRPERRLKITGEQIAGIAVKLETATSLREIASDLGLGSDTVRTHARPIIDAMRSEGRLGRCECGRERFHPRGCRRGVNPVASDEQLAKRANVIASILTGAPYREIAESWGLTQGALRRYYCRYLTPEQSARRKAMERSRRAEPVCASKPNGDRLYAIISAAVARWMSDATRDDVISDMYLAVQEGELREQDIAAQAKVYASRAADTWENRFGPRSLDEPAYEGSRETFAAMIVDPNSLISIEERLSASDDET